MFLGLSNSFFITNNIVNARNGTGASAGSVPRLPDTLFLADARRCRWISIMLAGCLAAAVALYVRSSRCAVGSGRAACHSSPAQKKKGPSGPKCKQTPPKYTPNI